ncbi:hypothetical protein [Streptacidiphilus sp. EB103A]|uniref:hypothetical protein n=1 Tax=Streptacidiphilus sp. EB103A TaxID=3156275 RepID=UPI003516AA49
MPDPITARADRESLEQGARAVACSVEQQLTGGHYADRAARLPLTVATMCLQAAVGFLSSLTADPVTGPAPSVGVLLGGEYLRRAHDQLTSPAGQPADRQTLELGAQVAADLVRDSLTEAHYADPDAQLLLTMATQCLQAAAGFLNCAADGADPRARTADGGQQLRLAYEQLDLALEQQRAHSHH